MDFDPVYELSRLAYRSGLPNEAVYLLGLAFVAGLAWLLLRRTG